MNTLRILRGEREVGRLALRHGELAVEVADDSLREKVRQVALRPLHYLRDEPMVGGEKTVKATALPGTEEHLRVLMFELRRLGLEGRAVPPGEGADAENNA